jgi:hypothetical protein
VGRSNGRDVGEVIAGQPTGDFGEASATGDRITRNGRIGHDRRSTKGIGAAPGEPKTEN